MRVHDNTSFKIDVIDCDNGFRSIMDKATDGVDCRVNCLNAQDHEPRIERNNRTIRNQVQLGLHRTGCKAIPRLMIKELAINATNKHDFFTAKKGTSDMHSTETLVTGRQLDYKKHCPHEFGECVQTHTHETPRNDMTKRTLHAIHLCPNDNDQGGHALVDLMTGSRITRHKIRMVPLTSLVKNQVEALAAAQGMTDMKFTNEKGETLPHADWTA